LAQMADCECLVRCPFFNDKMAKMPGIAGMMKARYCKGDNSRCARYMVVKGLGREKVPADLYPNETERAEALVSVR
jgi:hypothetical protein